MSSLLDGDWGGMPGGGAGSALRAWRDDTDTRQAWHVYQLIGDVMRSDDLARPAAQELAFLSQLRDRLETEPVHLRPATASAPGSPVSAVTQGATSVRLLGRWQAGAALAASVAVLAVTLLVSRVGGLAPGNGEPTLASHRAGPVANSGSSGVVVGAVPVAVVNSGGVLRDPRLDEFLRLHQMARGGLPVGGPGGTLQRADLQMSAEAGR